MTDDEAAPLAVSGLMISPDYMIGCISWIDMPSRLELHLVQDIILLRLLLHQFLALLQVAIQNEAHNRANQRTDPDYRISCLQPHYLPELVAVRNRK